MSARVTIVCVGKSSRSEYDPVIRMYSGRIATFITLAITEIPCANFKQPHDRIRQESGLLLDKSKDSWRVLLDGRGKEITTEDLANLVSRRALQSGQRISFIIGGPCGVNDELKTAVNQSITVSKLNLPYLLVRTILLEQLYRGFTLIRNIPYQH